MELCGEYKWDPIAWSIRSTDGWIPGEGKSRLWRLVYFWSVILVLMDELLNFQFLLMKKHTIYIYIYLLVFSRKFVWWWFGPWKLSRQIRLGKFIVLVSTFLLFIDLTNLFSFLFSLKKTDIIYVTWLKFKTSCKISFLRVVFLNTFHL